MNVIKRSGKTQHYEQEKVAKSIRNTAEDLGEVMSDRDVSLISSDVTKHIIELRGEDFLTSTFEIRMLAGLAIEAFGYKKIAMKYLENAFH